KCMNDARVATRIPCTFFFSSRRRHTRWPRDWSSDVCSSDLLDAFYRVPKAQYQRIFDHFKVQCDAEHDEVVALSGLHILATERHEARRIDNQLRGRAGRQGDPGSSRFYLSLEDDLMRIFGSDRISGLMQKLGMEEGVPIEHGM